MRTATVIEFSVAHPPPVAAGTDSLNACSLGHGISDKYRTKVPDILFGAGLSQAAWDHWINHEFQRRVMRCVPLDALGRSRARKVADALSLPARGTPSARGAVGA